MPPRESPITPIRAAHGAGGRPYRWHVSVDSAVRGSPARRYGALIWTTGGGPFGSSSPRGRGATVEAAPAHALAITLHRQP
jgi:hypothetical protein